MSFDLGELSGVFFEEGLESCDVMEAGLLALERGDAGPDVVHDVFRGAHSIKGASAMFGFEALAELTHRVETLLDGLRAGTRDASPALVGLLLEAVDAIRATLERLRGGGPETDPAATGLSARLAAALDDAPMPPDAPAAGPARERRPVRIRFAPGPGMLERGNDPLRILRELAELGELAVAPDPSRLPAFDDLEPERCHLAWEIGLRTDAAPEAVAAVFDWVREECELEIETAAGDGPPAGPPAPGAEPEPRPLARPAAAPERRDADAGSIRVGIDKVDAIINLVGELVITQSMLQQVRATLDGAATERLDEGLAQLARNTRELQERVLQMRMLPIQYCFNRIPRLVRDLAARLDKRVELELEGEHTELDKTVLEKLNDPLVHIVRNALDHGIETPARRRAAGKPEVGRLRVGAAHEGGNIVIEVADDGAGLCRERLLARAVERGLVARPDELSAEEVHNLIFQPGFSTASAVSDVSGRGVGMDVVRRNITDLGGSVELRSREGEGTTLTIRLPLTLAILDGQLVRVGRHVYVISLLSIVETQRPRAQHIESVGGATELYRVRDAYLPVVRLHRRLGIEGARERLEDGLLVVVESEGRRAGLLVDELLGQQQVVIKSLEANFRPVPGLAGATILGDGTVALILDVPGLLDRALGTREKVEAVAA